MTEKRTMNVSVQVLPLVEDAYPIVDKAIEAIQASGVKYEVGPLETTLEGDDLDQLIEVAKAAHREGTSRVIRHVARPTFRPFDNAHDFGPTARRPFVGRQRRARP